MHSLNVIRRINAEAVRNAHRAPVPQPITRPPTQPVTPHNARRWMVCQ